MGIWPDGSDGTDINALDILRDNNNNDKLIITADDHGKIKLFNAPCVVEDAPYYEFSGHSSHVSCVRWLTNNIYACSAGGNDGCLILWKPKDIKDE